MRNNINTKTLLSQTPMMDCKLENKNYQNCDNFLDLTLMNIINAKNEKLSMIMTIQQVHVLPIHVKLTMVIFYHN